MYNRYIPQPDGTYRRNRIDDPVHKHSQQPNPPPPPTPEPCEPPKPSPPCQETKPPSAHCHGSAYPNQSAGRFLRQLLPRDFDTGDLMVILLLLLIAGDCPEERNNALLTLALYFIM